MIDSYSIEKTFAASVNIAERIQQRANQGWGGLSLLHEASVRLPDDPWNTPSEGGVLWAYVFDLFTSHRFELHGDRHNTASLVWWGGPDQEAPFGQQMRAIYQCHLIRKGVERPEDVARTLAAHDLAAEVMEVLHARIPDMVQFGHTSLTCESGYPIKMDFISQKRGVEKIAITEDVYRDQDDTLRFLTEMLEQDGFGLSRNYGHGRAIVLNVEWRGPDR